MASVIKLVLTGDSKSLKAAIDSGSLSLTELSAKSRESINSFAKWGAAGTVAGAAIIAGVVNSSRKSIDVLAKKSDQLGIATEKLVAFQHLGELTGVSANSMNSSLERMGKRLVEAAQGMGAARPRLERLNLSAAELVKLSPDEQYKALAESVKGLSTQSEKAAAVAALFGREGLALLNTIEAGAEGFAQAESDVAAFGTAISRVDAAKVEEANDSFERVQEALKGVATQLTVQLAPIMKFIADRFVDAARESGGFTDQIVSGMNLAIEAVAFFADTIRGLQVVWKLAEVAAMGFISLTLTGLDELQKAATGALSWIPGVDIAPSSALSEWAEESRQALIMTNKELGKLIDDPMPSTNVKQFFATIKEETQIAAEAIAESRASEIEKVIEHQAKLTEVEKKALDKRAKQEEETRSTRVSGANQLASDTTAILLAGHKTQFNAGKNLASAQALTETYSGAQKAFSSLASIPIVGPALGIAAAAAATGAGLLRVKQIQGQTYSQAHDGLDRNPNEGTFLLKRNEMVLDSGTSQAVREAAPALAAGGAGEGAGMTLIVNINSPMSNPDWDSIAENEIKPAFDRLFNRDSFLEGVVYG